MSLILGITDGDDAGAVLLRGGKLVAAVNEERLNRYKMSIGFPRLAVSEVLRLAGHDPKDVDVVAVAAFSEKFSPEARPNKGWFNEVSTLSRIRNEIAATLAGPLHQSRLARRTYGKLKRWTLGPRRSGVKKILAEVGVLAPIRYHEHHACHALAAYAASGFGEALSLSLDGGGDGCSSHVYDCRGTRIRRIHSLDSFDSIGNYYAYVTHLCGFRASIHEGKITGLAAHGQPVYVDMFRRLIRYRDGNIENIGGLFYTRAISVLRNLLPPDWEHKDLAASIQQHLEDVAVAYVRHWLRATGHRKICLSGGVFANVRLNQKIAELEECDAVFVFPAMGDGGLAAGAAICEALERGAQEDAFLEAAKLDHVYLGTDADEKAIERALSDSGLPFRRPPDLVQEVARLVHQGRVVARCDGRMEYGPRALGNRTILYRTTDPSVNDWLNKRLNRTEFMPFAPACLAGREDQLFRWNPAAERAARYMTITLDCTPWMKEHCPAVVHVDGTARPQIVDREINPELHAILESYERLSGIPAVVNTSFNMHEEPIVATPADALRSFQAGQLDALALGPFLVERGR